MDFVSTAKVPVLKLLTVEGQAVDITSRAAEDRHSGVAARNMIHTLLHAMPEVWPLTMVIKQFLKEQGFNESFQGGLSSFAITLMVTAFVQMAYTQAGIVGAFIDEGNWPQRHAKAEQAIREAGLWPAMPAVDASAPTQILAAMSAGVSLGTSDAPSAGTATAAAAASPASRGRAGSPCAPSSDASPAWPAKTAKGATASSPSSASSPPSELASSTGSQQPASPSRALHNMVLRACGGYNPCPVWDPVPCVYGELPPARLPLGPLLLGILEFYGSGFDQRRWGITVRGRGGVFPLGPLGPDIRPGMPQMGGAPPAGPLGTPQLALPKLGEGSGSEGGVGLDTLPYDAPNDPSVAASVLRDGYIVEPQCWHQLAAMTTSAVPSPKHAAASSPAARAITAPVPAGRVLAPGEDVPLTIEDPMFPGRNAAAASRAFGRIAALFHDMAVCLRLFAPCAAAPTMLSVMLRKQGLCAE